MEGKPPRKQSPQHHQDIDYSPQASAAPWAPSPRRHTLAELQHVAATETSARLLNLADTYSNLLPQQPLFHHAQLLQYNKLISSRSTTPLPPLLSAQHVSAVQGKNPRKHSRYTDVSPPHRDVGGHGNATSESTSKYEGSTMTDKKRNGSGVAPKMLDLKPLPTRPVAQHQASQLSTQSNSVPSTPQPRPRKLSFESREPSPPQNGSHSPRSAYSESNLTFPVTRAPPPRTTRCPYETAMAWTRRRMPYNIGCERLPRLEHCSIKGSLTAHEERTLTTDMREIYDRLLPTAESESRRMKLVAKLERLFNTEWPGHDIQVHMFGSSGNMLYTDASDVDICITTAWRGLDSVCKIAALLAKNGMQQVICVSTAKVPIVKIYDPELALHCDMNVNNTLALENTRMIKTYVQIDPRVRPLAMIIKHWTKRRVVNDAAFGGTLSSYTWICMIINFLQSRHPPIVPALHQIPGTRPRSSDESAFADDLSTLKGFGDQNTSSLGDLLFQFFKFYGYEFDYDELVVSVRQGTQLPKKEKKWHLSTNNMLCVEEPFNISRNLGNTADDTSFRGLHMELRRAFDLVGEAKLEECCEEYVFPKEEERIFERPAPKPKPTLTISRSTSQSGRAPKGTTRGGKQNGHRSASSNRRASAGYEAPYLVPFYQGIPPQDGWLHQQAQTQLHNHLYNTYSVLQAQENSLRLQLASQGMSDGKAQAQYAQMPRHGPLNMQHADRHRTGSFDQPPLTAPLRPNEMYYWPPQYMPSPMYVVPVASATNPSSPSLAPAVPDSRRSAHRSSVTGGIGLGTPQHGNARSHSQPASRPPAAAVPARHGNHNGLGIYALRQVNGVPIPNFLADENLDIGQDASTNFSPSTAAAPSDTASQREYVGYYVNETPYAAASVARASPAIAGASAIQALVVPSFGDIPTSSRRLSTDRLPQTIKNKLRRSSQSPSPPGHDRIPCAPTMTNSAPTLTCVPHHVSNANLRALDSQSPIVANGSTYADRGLITEWQRGTEGYTAMTEDRRSDITASTEGTPAKALLLAQNGAELVTSAPSVQTRTTPLMANDSNSSAGDESYDRPQQSAIINGSGAPSKTDKLRLPMERSIYNRRLNGSSSPLDLEAFPGPAATDPSNLSPVYETRTPSPTSNRKVQPLVNGHSPSGVGRAINGDHTVRSKDVTADGVPGTATGQAGPTHRHIRGSLSDGGSHVGGSLGAWQKMTTKSKKRGEPSSEMANGAGRPAVVNGSGEQQPTAEEERKGG